MEPVLLPTGPKSHSAPVSRSEKISDGTATPGFASSTSSPALSSADPSDFDGPTQGQHDESGDYAPDFLWMTTEEPHRSRRIAILKAHPEVRKLMGPTWVTVPLVFLVLGTQLALSVYLSRFPTISLPVLLTAYVVGGAANQNIFLAIHEITHNLALKSIKANKCLAIIANLTIGVPYAMAFKGYHIEHHKFLGEDGIDTDLPSRFEAIVLNNVAGKTFFATFQLLFYAIRPGFIRSQQFTRWHAYNILSVVAFHLAWYHIFGIRPWVYLVLSSFFAGSLHPCAAHFIAEHYLMEGPLPVGEKVEGDDLIKGLAQETTSYYGWLNILCYNVGYHNEHHDFPSVPWTRLPELRAIAHEFYDPLPVHKSWPYVTWKFITDPSVGMWCRAKRESKGERLDEKIWAPGGAEGLRRGSSRAQGEEEDEEEERGYASDREEKKKRA
ncbi:hypothetical protein L202_01188 [Cryptococcus amylolentus CBS 6039]|uniref:sphingolipid 4-desaturase n=1 Tax=Cryptococcus amylolentus CBS 6039 TaxID=1295533 RepID=A0A1E3I2V7_9TREE|nr:hypothetical protein L202_01188 [Cryptococcus amylolentus CBS 6039]ODN82944.1 hypothetical protein L202_01188 [Cryptococcus amylolentus CBS 6039]